MPTKQSVIIQTQTNSQASTRTVRVFTDQHRLSKFPDLLGRPFWTFVEQPADGMNLPMPCTGLTPGGRHQDGRDLHWEAPFYPDMKYADYSRTQYGQFRWNYQLMRSDDQNATKTFYAAGARIAATRGWEIPAPGKPLPFQISVVLGKVPRSPLIAQALLVGNPWLIGEQRDPDDDLLPSLLRELRDENEWTPALTATEAIAAPQKDLDAIVAEAVAKALAQRDEIEQQRRADKMEKVRAKRGVRSVGAAA